jgi:hypothetical protein
MTTGVTPGMTVNQASNETMLHEQPGSTTRLKKIFDQSLAVLCNDKEKMPLRRSSLPLHIDGVNLQKRALSDAANALAALWKISDPSSPKLRRRVLQYGR